MTIPRRARLVRVPLEGGPAAAEAALLAREDEYPFCLVGDWAGGGALVGSEPVAVAPPEADPFALLTEQPELEVDGEQPEVGGAPPAPAVGGGWFGFLGYGLGATLEPVPPGPPRPVPLPLFALAFYDHLLRLDPDGRWWFEALWSDERADALRERLELLRARLAAGVSGHPVRVGAFKPVAPGAAGHVAAVEACRERIAAGEIFQANLCMRLGGRVAGEPPELFARAARAVEPRYGALVAGPWGAVCSVSPELFLRRRGRHVVSEPIKGTAPRHESPDALAASAKNRAENVMIVDLMRNDLGRVCEYGSVSVPALTEPRPAPGVWHLVSTVAGTLRPDVDDGDLLRACFPPGSVTGAPKIRTMRVIAELEATGREAYTGAIGYASPVAGLELNVAIRTLELRGERIWLGAGGGIVADSDPEAEFEECLLKARPVIEAVGGRLAEGTAARRPRAPGPIFALADELSRPDPALGVFSTLLVRDGEAQDLAAHLTRLRASVRELYGRELPSDLERRLRDAAAPHELARLRVLASPGNEGVAVEPVTAGSDPAPVLLAPAVLPGGLGAHKWVDRRLLDGLARRLGGVPLLVDLDGEVLEAAHANVWIVEGRDLITPSLDGRLLPGTVRARVLTDPPASLEPREEPITLDRLAAADEVLLTSSIRGIHAATLAGARQPALAGSRAQH